MRVSWGSLRTSSPTARWTLAAGLRAVLALAVVMDKSHHLKHLTQCLAWVCKGSSHGSHPAPWLRSQSRLAGAQLDVVEFGMVPSLIPFHPHAVQCIHCSAMLLPSPALPAHRDSTILHPLWTGDGWIHPEHAHASSPAPFPSLLAQPPLLSLPGSRAPCGPMPAET